MGSRPTNFTIETSFDRKRFQCVFIGTSFHFVSSAHISFSFDGKYCSMQTHRSKNAFIETCVINKTSSIEICCVWNAFRSNTFLVETCLIETLLDRHIFDWTILRSMTWKKTENYSRGATFRPDVDFDIYRGQTKMESTSTPNRTRNGLESNKRQN